ncbi:MAG TPA: amino acid adenylation domain-containing protein, partial [Thermoanaerobaculia bacterium]|nr:amino acid adenylation domain-containing protein [Thermoanaerobaculia bacterium]
HYDHLDEPTVRRLVEHLEVLLAAATAAPRTPLMELPLLSAAESRQILERSAVAALPPRIAETLDGLLGPDTGREDLRLYILDPSLRLTPLGVPGEVYIGGPGIGRLALDRPELAAARLAPDPFASDPGGRLYRTGELARYRMNGGEDGEIELVERPAPVAPAAALPKRYVAPRTPVEEALAAIWQEMLGVSRVGREDDFFDLGGHSLLVTRVASRVRAELGATLSVPQMFEASTLAALAAAVEAAGGAVATAPAGEAGVTRRPPGDHDLPLSFSQERLWFLDRLDPGAPFFNIAVTMRLSGRLDLAALAASFDELMRRHEALRTAFITVEGQPRQRVLPFTPQVMPLIDLSALPPAPRGGEAERVVQHYADWRFDLTRGPLLVAALLRLEPEVHHCAAVFHHIASDGWSIGIFCQEIAALYPAFLEGRPSPLPELPVQYPDYALWQRRAIAGTLEREVAYWLERLSGEIAPLELPIDRPRPAVQSYRGGRLTMDLPPALGVRLNELSRREGATLFMTLLAAAKVLFHRWSGQDDILVGAPIAGRRMVETEGLIGFFLNTLVLRTDLSGDPSFRELLERVRAVTLGAYSHQDVPFEALLARLPQQRDPSRTPLFQVMFNMLNLPETGAVPLPGLTLEPIAVPELPSKFDLTFYVTELPDHGLFIHLIYNADLFAGERMEDLLAQLTLVLEQAAADPEAPVEALSLVTPAARAVLPDPAAPLDGAWVGAIHDLFSARARAAPERPAISDREGTWSYGELETASNRLAHRLLDAGVRQGDRVAVWAHRSAPVATAVLGALKAGAAFTMLDPAYPPARLVEILCIAAPRALVRLEAGGPLPDGVDVWLIEAGCVRIDLPRGGAAPVLERLAGLPGEPPAVATGPDDVAVLGFTSGSTGTPKGIAGRHGPLTHFLPWQCERFGLTAEDRFSLLSGLAHDPLQRDLFTPLYLGATIVVPDPEDVGVSGRLAAWVAREGVTVAHLTPAMGQILTERASGGAAVEAPSLRLVLLVGDALTRLDVARIRRLAPRVTCVNLYGSTETQRAVAYHVCAETGEDAKQVLPLGAGMRDAQLLVINRAGRLAGIGEVGEIAVRSPHLAQGYLGDPALTADKFRTNPFTGLDGDRIYRTGDLGRYLPDGEVTFAGRADQQVKIRGFRIEPAEIEARLAALPGVREAVVVAREDRGEKRLVAYIVAEGAAVSPAFLRQALRDRLPAYMVPSAFVLLERLPITPNGKVDRRALPAPVAAAEASVQAAPEGAIEERIAAVWREVLGVERVGVTDNFFDVGGHSLLLVRLHSRLQEELGREISLLELFNHPSIRSQADHLGGGRAPAVPAARPARQPEPEETAGAEGAAGGIAIVGMAGRF